MGINVIDLASFVKHFEKDLIEYYNTKGGMRGIQEYMDSYFGVAFPSEEFVFETFYSYLCKRNSSNVNKRIFHLDSEFFNEFIVNFI